jgi:hypothetical protein
MLNRAQIAADIKKRCDETGVYIPSQTLDSVNVVVDVIVESVNRELAALATKKPEPKVDLDRLKEAAQQELDRRKEEREATPPRNAESAPQQPRSNQTSNQGNRSRS